MQTIFLKRWITCYCALTLSLTKHNSLLFSQQMPADSFLKSIKTSTTTNAIHKRRNCAVPLLLSSEVLPVIFDRYIKNADYARISLNNIAYNLNPTHWTWDGDGFQTNQAAHPYHGSIFFNCFRSNNYSFWQSASAVCAGSYLWETFAENQAPAPNDFINTSFGGIVLGEVTHRLSRKLQKNNGRVFNRKAGTLLSFCLNPADAFTRMLNGSSNNQIDDIDSSKMRIELDLGIRKFNTISSNPFREKNYRFYSRLRLNYGMPGEKLNQPFSNFYVVAEIGADDSSFLNVVRVYGTLKGWRFFSDRKDNLITLSANYDYYRNQSFFYSGQSIKATVFTAPVSNKRYRFSTILGAGVVLLAAVPNWNNYKGRDYDYGPGISFDGGVKLSVIDRVCFEINYRGGWMKTVSGNSSNYFLHAFTQDIDARILKNTYLTWQTGYFNLHGNFKESASNDKKYPYIRLSLRYAFDF